MVVRGKDGKGMADDDRESLELGVDEIVEHLV